MKKKISLAVIFGGVSGEHEVSLRSAASVMAALDPAKYDITPVLIQKSGRWLIEKGPALLPNVSQGKLMRADGTVARKIDVVLPLVHGTGGEDGGLQGLLELAGLPYVGSGILGSAVGMDKVVQKKILEREGLPVAPHLSFKKSTWEAGAKAVMDGIEDRLGYPNFVKPANLGSSVGISKAHHRRELKRAIDEALAYDTKIIVEKAVPNAREIECAVIGNDDPRTSVLGEIVPSNEFYDYAAKYLDDRSLTVIPADLPKALAERMRQLAARTFVALDASGMARVDFLVDSETNDVFVNEINTIPGFTSISMFPKLWEASGLPYGKLLDTVIALAVERAAEKRALRRSYSPVKV